MRKAWFLGTVLFPILVVTSIPATAQTITITSIRGVTVPPDEVFVSSNQFPVVVEWQASQSATTVSVFVDGQTVFCDGICSGNSGFFQLDEPPGGCRHTIRLIGTFIPQGMRASAPAAFWSSPFKDCTGVKGCNRSSVGKPVDVATGKMYYEMTDLSIQGPLPITFSRRYDSQSAVDGPMGYGWQHSYQLRIEGAGTGREVLVDREQRRIYFNQLPMGAGWDANRIDNLALISGGTSTWRVTDKQQTKYDFDSSGRLVRIFDRTNLTASLLLPHIVLRYDPGTGNLTSVGQDINGDDTADRSVTLVYYGTVPDRIHTLTAGGRTATYTYDGIGNLQSVIYSDGSSVTYQYNDTNEIGPKHNMTAALDSDGTIIEAHTYYSNDKVNQTKSAATAAGDNYVYTLAYDSPGANQTTVTNSRGFTTQYNHDSFSGLVKARTGPGCPACSSDGDSTRDYDRFLNLTTLTQKVDVMPDRFVTTSRTYDGNGNVLTRTEAQGLSRQRTWIYTYESHGFPLTESIPSVGTTVCTMSHPNKVITNTYDPSGNGDLRVRKVDGCNGDTFFSYITNYSYDGHGQVATVNGPRTDVTNTRTNLYYSDTDMDPNKRGRLNIVRNTLTPDTVYADYDLFGNARSVTDPNGVETKYQIDVKDRVTQIRTIGSPTPAGDFVTENHYDLEGNLDFVRLPNCVATGAGCTFSIDYTYDAVNRLQEIRDPFANKIVYNYDTEGNRTREEHRDAADLVHSFTNFSFDNLNRLHYAYFTGTVPPNLGSIYSEDTYYPDGLLKAERDPEGHTTAFAYDDLRRLATVTETAGTDTLTTTYDYDRLDGLVSVRDPNSTGPGSYETTYQNGDMGWRVAVTSPDTGTTTYAYDPAGNLTTSTDANGAQIGRGYDALDRPTNVDYPGTALDVTYTYDSPSVSMGRGRRTGMIDPSGTSVFHYDRRGFLTREEKTIGPKTYTTQYEYDKTGNRTRVLYPTDDPLEHQGEADSTYDAADRISGIATKVNGSIVNVATNFAYKPFGPRTQLVFGNGLTDTRTFSCPPSGPCRYQLMTWTLGSLLNYTHSFNNDLNLTARTDNMNAANNRSFVYDGAHRLTTAQGPWGPGNTCSSATYTYEKNGNRLCRGETATPTTYGYFAGTNRLKIATIGMVNTSYTPDNNGNITAEGSRTFQYNAANRLSTVDSGKTATYTYDGEGRRAAKKVTGITTLFFYDPNGFLLTEMVAAMGPGKDYLYLGETPIARVDWSFTELTLGNVPLRVAKTPTSVNLSWTNYPSGSNDYVLRRKHFLNLVERSFSPNEVIATTSDPIKSFDDTYARVDSDFYEYEVFLRTGFSDSLRFYHTDHLGTPVAVTNSAGVFVWRVEQRPFGDLHSQSASAVANNLRFKGQYLDTETGSHQNVFRDYSPSLGRYLEPDPLQSAFAVHGGIYPYAAGNPVRNIDPLGLVCGPCCDSPGKRAADKAGMRQAASLALSVYLATHLYYPVKMCSTFEEIVDDALTKKKPSCHDFTSVFSKEENFLGPKHVATAIRPCDVDRWEDGFILDAWPTGILSEYGWSSWKPRFTRFTPVIYKNLAVVGSCKE